MHNFKFMGDQPPRRLTDTPPTLASVVEAPRMVSIGGCLMESLHKTEIAAARLSLSVRKTKQLIADGRLRSVMVDGSRRVPESAINELIQQLIVGAA